MIVVVEVSEAQKKKTSAETGCLGNFDDFGKQLTMYIYFSLVGNSN